MFIVHGIADAIVSGIFLIITFGFLEEMMSDLYSPMKYLFAAGCDALEHGISYIYNACIKSFLPK